MQIDAETLDKLRCRLRYKVLYHLGRYCPDIDDVVQETLSRVMVAAQGDRIRNPDSLGAFVSATCNNVLHEYRRGLWREVSLDPEMPVHGSTPSAASQVEMRDLVARTLTELPERDRQLLHAFYLQEKPLTQIALETGSTESVLRVALFRARERFRKISDRGVKSNVSFGH